MSNNHLSNTKPLTLSVVIPTYNRANQLDRCLKFVFKQTHLPDEIIIVNNGEHEFSANTIKHPKGVTVQVIRNTTPSYARTRNIGLEAASSQVIALLDDDCIVTPRWAQEIVDMHAAGAVVVQGEGFRNALPHNLFSFLHNLRNEEGYIIALRTAIAVTFQNGKKTYQIDVIDNKNVSMDRSIITRGFRYASWLPQYVCADDWEFSWQLLQKDIPVYYNPQIRVYHAGRETFAELAIRSFQYGRSDRWIYALRRIQNSDARDVLIQSRMKAKVFIGSVVKLYFLNCYIAGKIWGNNKFNLPTRVVGFLCYYLFKIVRFFGFMYEAIPTNIPGDWQKHGAVYNR